MKLSALLARLVKSPSSHSHQPVKLGTPCPRCGASDLDSVARPGVCGACGYHAPLPARRWADLLLDSDSFDEIGRWLGPDDPLRFTDRLPYRQRLIQARTTTGERESVIAGLGAIEGQRLVLGVFEFGYIGGSFGSVAGEKLAEAFDTAREERLPVVIVTASGGVRLQEGLIALFQMTKVVVALRRFQQAGLPLITVLTNPTTGGVYASVASLGDIVLAEPGAVINFAGPRVVAELTATSVDEQQFTAERLLAHGLIDAVIERRDLRTTLARLLDVLGERGWVAAVPPDMVERVESPRTGALVDLDRETNSAWELVVRTRSSARPSGRDYVTRIFTDFTELRGDRLSDEDPSFAVGIGRLGGTSVAVIAQDRPAGQRWNRAAGFRKAARIVRLATRLRLPIITLVDSLGADPGTSDAELGVAPAVADCLAALADATVPVVGAIIGEGNSGGALALTLGDRILMQENAIFTPMTPEGAATVLLRDASQAPLIAERLKLTAADALEFKLIDRVIAEPAGGAARDPDEAARLLGAALAIELGACERIPPATLTRRRYERYRRIGAYRSQATVAVDEMLGMASRAGSRGTTLARRVATAIWRPLRARRSAA